MENIFLNLLTPELVNITKPKFNKLISYGYFFDIKLVYSLAWIYKYYFEENFILFLPKCINIEETLSTFNELVGQFVLTEEDICYCTLETIGNLTGKVVIYGFGDFIFNELVILNKRRINTILKSCKCKVIILSYTSLKSLDLISFDSFEYFEMKNELFFDFNYIDLLDPNLFDSNVESIV